MRPIPSPDWAEMKLILQTVLTAVPVAAVSSWLTAEWTTQEPQEPADAAAIHEMTPEEMMMEYMKLGQPGPEHEKMLATVGDWTTVTRMKTSPDSDWTEGTGSTKVQKALGGRFLVEKVEYNFNFGGISQKTNGILIMGYDNFTKKYQSMWIDSMSTGMFFTEGEMDENGVLELTGKMRDMMSPDGRNFLMRSVPKDKDHFVLEMYDSIPASPTDPMPETPNMKVMEIEYSRVKK